MKVNIKIINFLSLLLALYNYNKIRKYILLVSIFFDKFNNLKQFSNVEFNFGFLKERIDLFI